MPLKTRLTIALAAVNCVPMMLLMK